MNVRVAADRLLLRAFNDAPPLWWGVVTATAIAALLVDLAGVIASLNPDWAEVAEGCTDIAFFTMFPLWAVVLFGGAGQLVMRRSSWSPGHEPGHRAWRFVPLGVACLSVVCVVAIGLIDVSSAGTRSGDPTEIGGSYYLINHGDRIAISRAEYLSASAASARGFGLTASVFLSVVAVAAGAWRKVLQSGLSEL